MLKMDSKHKDELDGREEEVGDMIKTHFTHVGNSQND